MWFPRFSTVASPPSCRRGSRSCAGFIHRGVSRSVTPLSLRFTPINAPSLAAARPSPSRRGRTAGRAPTARTRPSPPRVSSHSGLRSASELHFRLLLESLAFTSGVAHSARWRSGGSSSSPAWSIAKQRSVAQTSWRRRRRRRRLRVRGRRQRGVANGSRSRSRPASHGDDVRQLPARAAPDARKTCSVCKSAKYCSVACQRKDWSRHKLVCVRPSARRCPRRGRSRSRRCRRRASTALRDGGVRALLEISRCTGPERRVHLDLCAFGGSVDALARPCWCGDVGTAQNVRGFVVLAEHARLAALRMRGAAGPGARGEGGSIRVEGGHRRAFDVKLRLGMSAAQGDLLLSLREQPPTPAAPLDASRGVCLRTSIFFLVGGGAHEMSVPPPPSGGPRAGRQPPNCEQRVWCGVGGCRWSAAVPLGAPPQTPAAAVFAAPFVDASGGGEGVGGSAPAGSAAIWRSAILVDPRRPRRPVGIPPFARDPRANEFRGRRGGVHRRGRPRPARCRSRRPSTPRARV